MKNVAIIGGGIAGLNAAYRLLEQGHRVTVYEKKKGAIDKVCGEGVLPFGVVLLDEMGWGREARATGQVFSGLAYSLGERTIQTSFREGQFGIGMDRARFDHLMKTSCENYSEFQLKEGVRAQPENLLQSYDVVLGADGVQGKMARWAGMEPIPSPRIGVRFRIQAPAPEKVCVHFFREGEIYLTPTSTDIVSVAMLLNRKKLPVKGKDLAQYCQDFFRAKLPQFADHQIQDFATRGHIAVRWRGKQPSVILLGDALRAFDPISGAGMSFALLCGKMAAKHLESPADYYRSMRRAVRAVGNYTALVKFFSGGGIRTRLMIRQLGKAPELFEKLVASHDADHQVLDMLDWQMAKQILRV